MYVFINYSACSSSILESCGRFTRIIYAFVLSLRLDSVSDLSFSDIIFNDCRKWRYIFQSNRMPLIFFLYSSPQVDHLFRYRINASLQHASGFLKQFPSPIISLVAKFISFVSGGFAAVLIIIAFLEESLLEGHVKHLTTSYHSLPAIFTARTDNSS